MAIKKAFREIDADVYVMVDADLTYPAADLPRLLEPVLQGDADMVCGDRHDAGIYSRENKRPMHNTGNKAVRMLINKLFQGNLHDILTGYRVFSKRFVKTSPFSPRALNWKRKSASTPWTTAIPSWKSPLITWTARKAPYPSSLPYLTG